MKVNIKRLHVEDATALIALRREALKNHPLAFSASIDDDRGLLLEFVRAALADDQEQAVFAACEDTRLVGMVGVGREAKRKRRHVALVWGMYVTPRARAHGVGRGLLAAAIGHARTWVDVEQVHLSVTDAAPAAQKLYEAAGFRAWGRELRALHWEGQFVGELHLVLDLRTPAAGR